MPAQDVQRNAPRRAVRRVNHQRAVRVRHGRRQLVQNISRPPAPLPRTDQARTGARAGVRPRPARPTPPRRTRPSFVGPTPEQAVREQVRIVTRKGAGHLRERERAAGRLRDVGLLPGMGPQEQRLADLRARQRATQRPQRKGGSFATLVAHVPGVGGALADAVGHIPDLTRIGAAEFTLGASEIPYVGLPFKKAAHALGKAGIETLDIASEVVPSTYHLLAPLAAPTHGSIGQRFHEGVRRVEHLGGQLAQPYEQVAKHPIRSITQQPVHTALLLGAPRLGAAGRDIVRGARAGAIRPGEVAAAVGEDPRFRASVGVEGTAIREQRHADSLTGRAQRRTDAVNIRKAAALRKEALAEPIGSPRAEDLMHEANRIDPEVMKAPDVARRMTYRHSVNEGVRRHMMGEDIRAASKLLGKKGYHELTRMIAAGEVPHTLEGIKAEGRRLQEVVAGRGRRELSPAERKAAQTNVRLLSQIVKDVESGKLDLKTLTDTALKYQKFSNALQHEARQADLLGPESEIARLLPVGNRELGIKYDEPHYLDREGKRLSNQSGAQRALHDPESVRKVEGAYVDPQGRRMSTEQAIGVIRSHIDEGIRTGRLPEGYDPAYFTQSRGKGGKRNFFMAGQRRVIGGRRRTGTAQELGLYEATKQSLIEAPALVRSFIQHDRSWKQTMREFGYRDPREPAVIRTWRDRGAVSDAQQNLETTTGRRWAIVQLHPFRAARKPLQSLIDATNIGEAAMGHLPDELHQAQLAALKDPLKGNGPWALIPEEAASELHAHLDRLGAGPSARVGQAATQAFRKAVLAFSTKWAAGNVIEAVIRTGVMGAGIGHYRMTAQALKEIEKRHGPQVAAEIRDAIGTGHFAGVERLNVYRPPKQWANPESGQALKAIATTFDKLGRASEKVKLSQSWGAYTHFVFGGMGALEGRFRMAMAGKLLERDGIRSIEEAVDGLTNTNTMARFARELDRAYGQYDKFRPDTKGIISRHTPFIPWFLNAVKFLTIVLPRDHPVLTSLLASANLMTEDWRKKHGLKRFTVGSMPAFLQGSIPTSKGHIRFQFTPFAAAADPSGTFAQAFFPQWRSLLNAFDGRDWKGDSLPKGTNKGWYFMMTAAGTFVPAAGVGLRVSGLQATSKASKKMSVGQRAVKEWNPLFPVEDTRGRRNTTKTPAGGAQNSTGGGWGDKPKSSRKPATAGWGG